MKQLTIILFLAIAYTSVAHENSPALLWSPERSMIDLPDISSVDSFSPSDFYDQYLSPLTNKENAIVFLQDKLSVDDFTNYADVYSLDSNGGAFKNIKGFMEDHFSLEIPQLDSPTAAVEKLKANFDGKIHAINKVSQLASLNLDDGHRFLLIVDLHPVIGSGDEEKTITQNDAVVGDVVRHLQEKGVKYSALFTGKSSPELPDSPDASLNSNRHLLAVESQRENCSFMNISDDSIYVFLCGFKACVKDDTSKYPKECAFELNMTLNDNDNVAKKSFRTNSSGSVILTFDKLKDDKGNSYDVEITFEVALKQDRWKMVRNSFTLKQSSGGGNTTDITNATLINYDLDTVVPRPYSFHCSSLRLFLESVKDKKYKGYRGTSLTLEGFQFQVFDIANQHFFHAQDCVGFFTAGIWMGIVPGLLLLAILVYGSMMVLSLSTMDKFDDPKGKTITVNNGE